MSQNASNENIQQLVKTALKKFTGYDNLDVILTKSPDNYKGLSDELCKISWELPKNYPKLFPPDKKNPEQDIIKFGISTTQIRDVYFRSVSHVKPWFRAALNIYVHGSINGADIAPGPVLDDIKQIKEISPSKKDVDSKIRETQEQNFFPNSLQDENTPIESSKMISHEQDQNGRSVIPPIRVTEKELDTEAQATTLGQQPQNQSDVESRKPGEQDLSGLQRANDQEKLPKIENTEPIGENKMVNAELDSQTLIPLSTSPNKRIKSLLFLSAILVFSTLFFAYKWVSERKNFASLISNIRFAPYKPTQAEIDSLEGIWLVTTGSVQARPSESDPWHKIVSNIVEVKYNGKYFTYSRYGPKINQFGYIQFERPGLVSIHSYLKTAKDTIVTPKLSLMILDTGKINLTAMSASWNFDPENNFIIGIREVYTKLGKGGYVEPEEKVIVNKKDQNTIYWHREDKKVDTFILENSSLENLRDESIKRLVNENSWIEKDPGIKLPSGKLIPGTKKSN